MPRQKSSSGINHVGDLSILELRKLAALQDRQFDGDMRLDISYYQSWTKATLVKYLSHG